MSPPKVLWDLPGGFAEFDESLEIALCRELHEELGLQLLPDALTYFTSRPNRYPFGGLTVHTLDAVFRAQLPHDVQLALTTMWTISVSSLSVRLTSTALVWNPYAAY